MKNGKIYILLIIILVIILLLMHITLYNYKCNENYENIESNENNENKIVCIYAYYEKNDMYKRNLEYFLQNGGILDNIDYYIIINGECSVDIPKFPNVKVFYRENKGFDFAAWQYIIKKKIEKSYDYYMFINTSVCGPYPKNKKNWIDDFLKLFTTGKDVKLVGTSINISNNESYPSHVQSMFFILNKEGYDFLYNKEFFDDEEILNVSDFSYVVSNKEHMMSKLILQNGWNINCILPHYRDLDYREVKENINPSGEDSYYKGAFFNRSITPEEVIFFKTNRGF